jgi:hypothetical protein
MHKLFSSIRQQPAGSVLLQQFIFPKLITISRYILYLKEPLLSEILPMSKYFFVTAALFAASVIGVLP